MDTKSPSPPNLSGSMGKDRVFCGGPYPLPQPLDDDEDCSHFPGISKDKERNRTYQKIASYNKDPVRLCPVGKITGYQPGCITDKLTKSCDERHGKCRGSEEKEIGTGNAPGAFIDDVAKKTYDTHQEDQPESQ